jgi:phosphoribosylglycinamide formyltransferase-1
MTYRVVAIISGRGSNMEALARQQSGYEISAVVSNKQDARGLEVAQALKIPTIVVPRADFSSVAEQKRALFREVCELKPDLITLAGYMQIVEPYFISRFRGRILNIHPSLLPDFPGLETHQRALDAGVEFHGCSVHFVDEGLDTGTLVAQSKMCVPPNVDADQLAALVLKCEHQIYPWVVAKLASGDIALSQNQPVFSAAARTEGSARGFILPGETVHGA